MNGRISSIRPFRKVWVAKQTTPLNHGLLETKTRGSYSCPLCWKDEFMGRLVPSTGRRPTQHTTARTTVVLSQHRSATPISIGSPI